MLKSPTGRRPFLHGLVALTLGSTAIAGSKDRPIALTDPQTLIWTVSAWAFLPASMVMRGVAMARIAELIEEKRRRVYANAEAMQTA